MSAEYRAPLEDMRFLLNEFGLLDDLADLPDSDIRAPDLVDAVLEEAAKFAGGALAPLNRAGDAHGAVLENGAVRTAPGFAEAYRRFVEGGWNALPFAAEHGGQGLPWLVAAAVQEMWQSANLAWGLCPLLNLAAIEAVIRHGTAEQKALYLPRMMSGEWTGTMQMTEPQSGSDLSLLKMRAERDGGQYRLYGQKIFISYGDHDMTANTIHMVLARLSDAPAGVKGISLFLVPKFLVGPDGSLGHRNDVKPIALEHKLGQHGAPTCVMAYGEDDGAIAFLVGEENRGLEHMFTMMNSARLHVGLQGLAIAERAFQQARAYAGDRVQGRGADGAPVTIIHHPDVRRMLMTMKAQTEAMRGFLFQTMAELDRAHLHPDADTRRRAAARVDLLTPVVKAWLTDAGVELASLGIQLHGGAGFIEETGAAQHLRDARILPIYEGTNGIQAIDLLGRKLLRDGGEVFGEWVEDAWALADRLEGTAIADLRQSFGRAMDALEGAAEYLLRLGEEDREAALTGATPFLRLFGLVAGGAVMLRSALAAQQELEHSPDSARRAFLEAKLGVARFYCRCILAESASLAMAIRNSGTVLSVPVEAL